MWGVNSALASDFYQCVLWWCVWGSEPLCVRGVNSALASDFRQCVLW